MKDKTTAAVLAFVIGGIGGHRFYLGETGWGLFYLFFCWTFIPAIASFIEGILFLLMNEERFHAKYSTGPAWVPVSETSSSTSLKAPTAAVTWRSIWPANSRSSTTSTWPVC